MTRELSALLDRKVECETIRLWNAITGEAIAAPTLHAIAARRVDKSGALVPLDTGAMQELWTKLHHSNWIPATSLPPIASPLPH